MQVGDDVKIRAPKTRLRPLTGLDAAFDGRTGTVISTEQDGRTRMYRVRLDEAVEIEGVGRVTDDLWCGQYLRKRRG